MNNSFKRFLYSLGASILGFFASYLLTYFLCSIVWYFSGTFFVQVTVLLGVIVLIGLGLIAYRMKKKESIWFWFFVFAILGMLIGGYFSIRLIPAIQAF